MAVFGGCDCYAKTVCSFFLLILHSCITVAMKDLRFVKADCDVYRHYLMEDSDRYQVVWDGEPYPEYCNIRFDNGYDREYEICAEVTLLALQCGGPEVVYSYFDEIKRFTCNENGKTDKYCDDSLIYVKLDPFRKDYEQHSSSKLRIKVYRQWVGKPGTSYESSSGISSVAVIMIAVVIGIFVFLVVVCIYAKRRRDLRNMEQRGGVMVLGNRGNMVVMAAPADQAARMLGNRNSPNRGRHQNSRQSDETNYQPQIQYNSPPSTQYTYSHPESQPHRVGEPTDQHSHKNRNPRTTAPPPPYNEVVYLGKA